MQDGVTEPTTERVHRAWLMLGVIFVGVLAAQGVRLAFGAFVEPWEASFNVSRGTVTAVSLVGFLVYGAAQPLVGRIADRTDVPRLFAMGLVIIAGGLLLTSRAQTTGGLIAAYGVIASVGFGMAASVAASVLVARWFTARRGLAFGILEAGFGAGQLVVAPAALFAISRFGWRPTLVAMAIVLLALAPVMLLLLANRPEDVGLAPLGGPEQTIADEQEGRAADLLRTKEFWFLGIPFFICGITTTGMIDTHLIPFAHDHGNSDAVTSLAVAALAVFNIIGTAGSGLLVDRIDPRRILGWLYAARAVILLLVLVFNQGAGLIVFAVLFGLVDFATVAPTQTLVSRYFGARSMGFAFGLVLASHQVGSALGAYLPGLAHDLTNTYNPAFVLAAGQLVIASVMSFALPTPRTEVAVELSDA